MSFMGAFNMSFKDMAAIDLYFLTVVKSSD